jgi:hypothetical protein
MAEQLQKDIRLIINLLCESGPDYPDRQFYLEMVEEQYKELASLQAVRTIEPTQPATDTQLPDVYRYSRCSRPTHKYLSI